MNKQKKYWWDYFAVVSILGENWRVSRLSKEQEQEKLEMMENDTLYRLLFRQQRQIFCSENHLHWGQSIKDKAKYDNLHVLYSSNWSVYIMYSFSLLSLNLIVLTLFLPQPNTLSIGESLILLQDSCTAAFASSKLKLHNHGRHPAHAMHFHPLNHHLQPFPLIHHSVCRFLPLMRESEFLL